MLKRIKNVILNYTRTTDRALWSMCLLLSCTSLLLLGGLYNTGYATGRQVLTQAIAILMGVVCALIISNLDYNVIAGLWRIYLPLVYLLMAATFVIGMARGDDQAWIVIGGFSVQPSEILKVAFILAFSLHLSNVQDQLGDYKQLIAVLLHGALPVMLIYLQGDAGSALMMGLIVASMIFAAGLSWRIIIMAVGSLVVVAPLVWVFMLNADQKSRILIFANPDLDPLSYGYQQLNGLLAIGSGQIRGTGIFSQNHVYTPEIRNDFIFSFLGNSMGFVGCLGICILLFALCMRLLWCAFSSRDKVGYFICVGAFAMVAFQSIFNIGMCLSVLPVIGITLPFLSSGGTSVLALYAVMGFCLSVKSHSSVNMFG